MKFRFLGLIYEISNIAEGSLVKKLWLRKILTLGIILFSTQLFGQSKAEQEILQLSKSKFRWQVESKFDSLANLFDNKITLQHGSGRIQSKAEYFKTLENGMLKYQNIDVTEQTVNVIGCTAVIVGKVKFNILLNGEKKDFDYGFTEVYTQNEGQWKLVLYSFRNNVQ